jgi:hypothetical protein
MSSFRLVSPEKCGISRASARCQGRDKDPETAPAIQWADCRDKMRARIAASSGLFALNREISVRARLCGGAERTRTACQPRSRYRTDLRPGPIWRIFCDQMSLNCRRTPQKGLAISCKRSGTIGNSGRLRRSEILPRRLDRRGGASVVRREAVISVTEDLNVKVCEEAITLKIPIVRVVC